MEPVQDSVGHSASSELGESPITLVSMALQRQAGIDIRVYSEKDRAL